MNPGPRDPQSRALPAELPGPPEFKRGLSSSSPELVSPGPSICRYNSLFVNFKAIIALRMVFAIVVVVFVF